MNTSRYHAKRTCSYYVIRIPRFDCVRPHSLVITLCGRRYQDAPGIILYAHAFTSESKDVMKESPNPRRVLERAIAAIPREGLVV
jgi:hypothetical protein